MILSRYRDSPSATVTDRYRPLLTVTESYRCGVSYIFPSMPKGGGWWLGVCFIKY